MLSFDAGYSEATGAAQISCNEPCAAVNVEQLEGAIVVCNHPISKGKGPVMLYPTKEAKDRQVRVEANQKLSQQDTKQQQKKSGSREEAKL